MVCIELKIEAFSSFFWGVGELGKEKGKMFVWDLIEGRDLGVGGGGEVLARLFFTATSPRATLDSDDM